MNQPSETTENEQELEKLAFRARQLIRGVVDLVFPRDCVVNHTAVEENEGRYLSKSGQKSLVHARAPQCTTCGFPFFGEMIGSRVCPHCQELDPVFEEGRTLLLAREGGRALVHELKYRGGRFLLPDIEQIVRQRPDFLEFLAGSTLVPVPLFPKREKQRGYNQSLLLAECMAQCTGGISVENLLIRTRDTPSQTRLKRKQRQENVKNAFALRDGISLNLRKRYIIVDDVFTTGATLNACAKVLRKAGATQIAVATLAHG